MPRLQEARTPRNWPEQWPEPKKANGKAPRAGQTGGGTKKERESSRELEQSSARRGEVEKARPGALVQAREQAEEAEVQAIISFHLSRSLPCVAGHVLLPLRSTPFSGLHAESSSAANSTLS
uniref:Uncharacterized protein n=1 Tax=Aegilops tauschii TaxID=37682 RepID=M8CFH1_AEGTA